MKIVLREKIAHGSDLGPQPLARGALADAQDWDGEQVSIRVSYNYIKLGMVALLFKARSNIIVVFFICSAPST